MYKIFYTQINILQPSNTKSHIKGHEYEIRNKAKTFSQLNGIYLFFFYDALCFALSFSHIHKSKSVHLSILETPLACEYRLFIINDDSFIVAHFNSLFRK